MKVDNVVVLHSIVGMLEESGGLAGVYGGQGKGVYESHI